MIDSDTLQRLHQGDALAFEKVVRAYEHEMLCVAARITGQLADAEEVRQRILMRIWKSPQLLPVSVPHFEAWLRRCVINESISHIRQRKRHDLLATEFGNYLTSTSHDQTEPDVEVLRLALDQLEPEDRALLALKFDQQLTVREMGVVFERAHTTIQSQLDRALAKLRTFIQTLREKTDAQRPR